LKVLSEGYKLENSSISLGGFTTFAFALPRDSVRFEGIAILQRLIKVGPELGSKVILVPFFEDAGIRQEGLTSE